MRKLLLLLSLLAVLLLTPPVDAQVLRWGNEEAGTSTQTTPVEIPGLPEAPLRIAASNNSAYALLPDGAVYASGDGAHGDTCGAKKTFDTWSGCGFPERIVSIGEARDSLFAVGAAGNGYAVGAGGEGMFCNGKSDIEIPAPVPITNAVAVAGGSDHVLWLTSTGKVEGCGENRYGQLGLGPSVQRATTLTEVPGLSHVVELSAGWGQSLARTSAGSVFVFGANKGGEVCAPPQTKEVTSPTEVFLPGAASQVSAGGSVAGNGASMFLIKGVPYGCGHNEEGQLADGETTNAYTPTIASELALLGVSEVVTAGETTEALAEGQLYTVGSGGEGDLGNDKTTGFSLTPFHLGAGVEVSATARDMLARG